MYSGKEVEKDSEFDEFIKAFKGIRQFPSGATRDTKEGKLEYEGFLSPLVLKRYAEYLHAHRVQSDGQLRDADNWQKGMPKDVYIDSLLRHVMDLWLCHDGYTKEARADIETALCGIIFNSMGYLFEHLKEKDTLKKQLKNLYEKVSLAKTKLCPVL